MMVVQGQLYYCKGGFLRPKEPRNNDVEGRTQISYITELQHKLLRKVGLQQQQVPVQSLQIVWPVSHKISSQWTDVNITIPTSTRNICGDQRR
ncbi:unnamed protein product [Caretta caretta]